MKRDKENILFPQVDLQPVIRAFHFLLRQLSKLLPFVHPLPVFSLLFPDNTAVDHNGFDTTRNVSYADANEDVSSRFPGKPGDTGVTAKTAVTGSRQEPAIYKPGALQINMHRFYQDQKKREEISTPGLTRHTLLIEPHIHSMRFLTTDVRKHFPGFDFSPASLLPLQPEYQQPGRDSHSHKYPGEDRYPSGDFNGNRGGLSSLVPVMGIFNKPTLETKENDRAPDQQNPLLLRGNNGVSPGINVAYHISRSGTVSPVIKAFKNVRFVNQVIEEAQNKGQLNVYSQGKMSPASTTINENKQEYGMGLTPLYTVNRSLEFLNEVVQPTVVQVNFEEDTKAISHPAAKKVYVNHENFLSARDSNSETKFTAKQEKTWSKTTSNLPYDPVNAHQESVPPTIQYIPMSARHFLETRRVDSAAGASSMSVRTKTYNIAPSLTSLAAAGNVLSGTGPGLVQIQRILPVGKLASLQASIDNKPTARRAIKSFSGGPGGRFFKKAPLAAGGTLSPVLRAAEELPRHVHEYGHELSTAVIIEKIYNPQFATSSKGSDSNLNFSHSRDNQNQEVTNTFNVTMNVSANSSFIEGDAGSFQDLGEKLAEILTDEARRYGIKV